MSMLGGRDTRPEMELRALLHATGLRYRVAYPVPGWPRRTIDIAFTRIHVAVFVDGCFWHRCPLHGTQPRSNADWWASKLEANVRRDAETTAHLRALGWQVLRFWEHEEPRSAAETVRRKIAQFAACQAARGGLPPPDA
ncbi:very short patch repair endonuclease [Occultella kanbiaonis]|uniref:very short patch repair endonuclease n=1 Tax=Occultella kanbiaonis TaxID=2675754 RepID=UPI001A99BA33|nr:very short patch repair endonuclease [Occultella kanbiaonis]